MVASSLPTAALGSSLMGIRTLFMFCFSFVTHTLQCSYPLLGLWNTCVMAKESSNCHCFKHKPSRGRADLTQVWPSPYGDGLLDQGAGGWSWQGRSSGR